MAKKVKLPDRVSYSQFSSYQLCKFQYYLKYHIGLEKRTPSEGLVKGDLLHQAYDMYNYVKVNDTYDVAYMAALERLEAFAQEKIDAGVDSQLVNTLADEAHELLNAYLPWCRDNDDFKVVTQWSPNGQCETEEEYVLTLPNGHKKTLYFKIDTIIRRQGMLMLMEHKFRKVLDATGLQHDQQTMTYLAAWNAKYKDNPDKQLGGIVYNIVGAKPRKKDGAVVIRNDMYHGDDEQRIFLANASATAYEMERSADDDIQVWPMNPGKHCQYMCDLVGVCMAVRTGAKISEFVDSHQYTTRAAKKKEAEDREKAKKDGTVYQNPHRPSMVEFIED